MQHLLQPPCPPLPLFLPLALWLEHLLGQCSGRWQVARCRCRSGQGLQRRGLGAHALRGLRWPSVRGQDEAPDQRWRAAARANVCASTATGTPPQCRCTAQPLLLLQTLTLLRALPSHQSPRHHWRQMQRLSLVRRGSYEGAEV